jgi:hypothetical protein
MTLLGRMVNAAAEAAVVPMNFRREIGFVMVI